MWKGLLMRKQRRPVNLSGSAPSDVDGSQSTSSTTTLHASVYTASPTQTADETGAAGGNEAPSDTPAATSPLETSTVVFPGNTRTATPRCLLLRRSESKVAFVLTVSTAASVVFNSSADARSLRTRMTTSMWTLAEDTEISTTHLGMKQRV